jgi:hypothetical protein
MMNEVVMIIMMSQVVMMIMTMYVLQEDWPSLKRGETKTKRNIDGEKRNLKHPNVNFPRGAVRALAWGEGDNSARLILFAPV